MRVRRCRATKGKGRSRYTGRRSREEEFPFSPRLAVTLVVGIPGESSLQSHCCRALRRRCQRPFLGVLLPDCLPRRSGIARLGRPCAYNRNIIGPPALAATVPRNVSGMILWSAATVRVGCKMSSFSCRAVPRQSGQDSYSGVQPAECGLYRFDWLFFWAGWSGRV